ncbi:MAG: hypothetical protein QM690_17240, partial [Sphingobium sp.]
MTNMPNRLCSVIFLVAMLASCDRMEPKPPDPAAARSSASVQSARVPKNDDANKPATLAPALAGLCRDARNALSS